MPSRSLTALTVAAAHAWNDCAFPDVGYFAMDEAPGISYSYALAAMNGNMYSGGYTKGNLALVGVTEAGDVNPVKEAAIYGDTTSDEQNLYISETNSLGSMTKSWWFKGSAIQVGTIGHGTQTNSIDAHSGLHKMMDKQHIAVKGGFRQLLELPDGTQWTSAERANPDWQVAFVMKLDVSSANGTGSGTTGWAKLMDEDHAGGAQVYSVDGDSSGNMIVSYQGCASFNATATSLDGYGRTVVGAAQDCVEFMQKLSAADGTPEWSKTMPTGLWSCRVITDGSFFCGWSMAESDGTLDFGNGITVASEDGKAGIVKFDTNGDALWAKATASHSFGDLSVSADGTVLVVIGSSGRSAAYATRISTAAGSEGTVLWTDQGGVGTHGFRGVEVTDDNLEVFVFGQVTGEETLTDANGLETKLRSRGSYEVFVAAYDASDGSGKYAMDGGGTGMEYFFAFACDPDTHEMYVGGTSRSEYITWGAITRKNVMYNGQPDENNPDTSSPVGSSKAFVVQIKSDSVSTQSCLDTCDTAFPLQASDVKSGYCYIDRYCYADGESAPYAGSECRKCDAAVNAVEWSDPDMSSHCFIDDSCVAHGTHEQVSSGYSTVDDPCSRCDATSDTGAFSAVAGCLLPSEFESGCFETDGAMLMTMATYMDEKTTMETSIATKSAEIVTLTDEKSALATDKAGLETDKAVLEATTDADQATITSLETSIATKSAEIVTLTDEKSTCQAETAAYQATNDAAQATILALESDECDSGMSKGVAMALISVLCVLFVLVVIVLVLMISRERNGRPVFTALNTGTKVDLQSSDKNGMTSTNDKNRA